MQKMPESTKKVPSANSFAERLLWLRTLKGLTLKQFSERIKCDSGYLSKLESGKSKNPSTRFLVHLSMAFFVNVRWLKDGVGQPFGSVDDSSGAKNANNISDDRLQRIYAILDELPTALDADRVLAVLLKEQSLKDLQDLWAQVRSLPGLQKPAVHFWNEAFLRAQFPKMRFGGDNQDLTYKSMSVQDEDVKGKWLNLKKQIQKATTDAGSKSKLAKFLGVDLTQLSKWLTDSDSAREPGAEYTLQMQSWVNDPKRQ